MTDTANPGKTLFRTVDGVDINDLGANILAFSEKSPSMDWLARVLADNPLGQGEECTPMGILRRS